jgi:hypothetical protein
MIISYYHRTQIVERTFPGVFYQSIIQLQLAAIESCIKLLQIIILTHILQNPNRPILVLKADISETIDHFVSMILANLTIGERSFANCES